MVLQSSQHWQRAHETRLHVRLSAGLAIAGGVDAHAASVNLHTSAHQAASPLVHDQRRGDRQPGSYHPLRSASEKRERGERAQLQEGGARKQSALADAVIQEESALRKLQTRDELHAVGRRAGGLKQP